jgi:MFS family permease
MSDAEWDRWKADWTRGDKPMPDVLNRARTDRRRALTGLVVVYAIGAGEIAFAAWLVAHRKGVLELVTPLVMLAVTLGLIAGMHRILRGTWADAETPLGWLDALEKRHAARRRLGRFVAWMMAATIVATFTLVALAMAATGRFVPGLAVVTLIGGAASGVFMVVVVRRASRTIRRDLAEAREARRLLGEGQEPS